MTDRKATDLSRAELVRMITDLRELLWEARRTAMGSAIEDRICVDLNPGEVLRVLDETEFDNDQEGQEFQCVVSGHKSSCAFIVGCMCPNCEELEELCSWEEDECVGFEHVDCPLNKFAEIRVRRCSGEAE